DRYVVRLKYRQEDPCSADANDCSPDCGAPKDDNRFGNKLPLPRCARQVCNVSPAALPGSETVSRDITLALPSKRQRCMRADVWQNPAGACPMSPERFGCACQHRE